MLREELEKYGGNDGYKLAIRMERAVANQENKPQEEKEADKLSLTDNLQANIITAALNCDKEVQVCFKEKKRFSLKANKAITTGKLASRENSEEEKEPVVKFIDNNFLLRLFAQKPSVTKSYIGEAAISGIKNYINKITYAES